MQLFKVNVLGEPHHGQLAGVAMPDGAICKTFLCKMLTSYIATANLKCNVEREWPSDLMTINLIIVSFCSYINRGCAIVASSLHVLRRRPFPAVLIYVGRKL